MEEALYDVLCSIVALSGAYDVDLESAMRLKEPLTTAEYITESDAVARKRAP